MVMPGVFRRVEQRQRLPVGQRGQALAFITMGLKLLAIALAKVGEIERLAVKSLA